MELTAPEDITRGTPIKVTFTSENRVSGRLRLTAGDIPLTFTLYRDGRDPVTSDGPRIRGKEGELYLTDWDAPIGSEVVVRFEGQKCWIKVR